MTQQIEKQKEEAEAALKVAAAVTTKKQTPKQVGGKPGTTPESGTPD